MQCLAEIIPRVDINIFHVVMLPLHISVHIDRLQRGHLQKNTFIIQFGQYVH